jgi:hypothetical protein
VLGIDDNNGCDDANAAGSDGDDVNSDDCYGNYNGNDDNSSNICLALHDSHAFH